MLLQLLILAFFKFNQHFNKPIPYSYCVNTVNVVNVVASGYFLHLLLDEDIENNTRPRNKQTVKNLSCCHWNVNRLPVHNLDSQIITYHSLFNHDSISISETYFDSSVLEGDRSFQLIGYNQLRADHPRNTKQGVVSIYYEESPCVREVKLSNLSQCVICEASLRNCKGYIGIVCRSPTQDKDEFKKFLSDFDELLSTTAL